MNTVRPARWLDSWPGRLGLLLLVLSGLRLVFAAVVELSPDEAYYWNWSRQLDFGYFDHGPLVAVLVRLGTLLAGNTELGVRLLAIAAGLLATIWLYRLTEQVTGRPAIAFWTAVLAQASPVFSAGSVIHTPDAALAAAWAGASWYLLRAWQTGASRHWLGAGVALGAALLAKASGLLLGAGGGLFMLTTRTGRQRLLRPGPALALLVALLLAAPMIVWNGLHAGGSFAFQWQHVLGRLSWRPRGSGELLGGQLGVVGPLTFPALLVAAVICGRRRVRRSKLDAYLLWCLSVPLLGTSVLLSCFTRVEANWPAPAYLSLLPATAWCFTGGNFYPRRLRLWTALAVGSAGLITLLAHLQALWGLVPLGPGHDPTERLRGWRELARVATATAARHRAQLAAEGYQTVSELRFYTGRMVWYQARQWRPSQYDLWQQQVLPGTDLVVLRDAGRNEPPPLCSGYWRRWLLEEPQLADRQGRAGRYAWWLCRWSSPGEEP